MWFFLAIGSALIYSLRSILEKRFLRDTNPYILALAVRLFALPLFFLPFIMGAAAWPDLSTISMQFWLVVLVVACISTPLEMIFFYKALKTEEVSYVAPLLGLSPVVTALFGALFFGEYPSLLGVLGMLLIIFALYTLNVHRQQAHFLDPFRYLWNNKAFKYILLMILSYSLGILLDKFAIGATDIYFYSLVNYLFVSVTLLVIASFKAKGQLKVLRANFAQFALIGLIVASYTWLRFAAIGQGNAGYVSAVLATSVLFSVIMGVVFFSEKNLQRKLLVSAIILVGLALIKIYG